MKYAKPEITRIAEATARIRDEGSLLKSVIGMESTDPHRMTPPAYPAAEEE
ncbi:MAG: hypothetical protein WAL95_11125 [Candidatus Acidiferrales bacterium]